MKQFNNRVREIGSSIFELADAARPHILQKSWWLEQATQLLDHDDLLRARAFQFVDCLPSLKTDADIARHVAEYFDPDKVNVPRIASILVGPGRLHQTRERFIGWAARLGAMQMAGRFITGYDAPTALNTIEKLRDKGMGFTIDVLGESTTSSTRADQYGQIYHDLIEQLTPVAARWPVLRNIDTDSRGPIPRVNLSIKLTGLDPHFDAIDPDRAISEVSTRLRPIFRAARRTGALVNIDMEAFRYRDLTLALFKQILLEEEFRDWTDVGIVVQAYLKDGERDLMGLLDWGRKRGTRFAIRLVKGAYWDAESANAVRNYKEPPVWTRKWESDACYERMTRAMLQHEYMIRPAFASHNVRSLAVVMATAEALRVPPNDYEVQMLYGMGDPLKTAMVQLGQSVRVYCPYGDLMPGMGYLIRRLLENTSNEGFLKQSFGARGTHARLLADPTTARPPSAALPSRHYQNSDPEEPMAMFQNASNTNFAVPENREKIIRAIDYVRSECGRTYPLIIGDQSVSTKSWFDSVNPSRPNEIIGQVAKGTPPDVDRAVEAAQKAFTSWRATGAPERAQLLRKVADRLEMRRFELAATMILEVGKPWREADADVTEAIDHWRYYADQIERIESRPRLRNVPGEDNMLTYFPKGVCAVIAPWAFPMAILSGMTSAALAAGNTVVMKPARQASVVAAKLVEILLDVGIPPGVINYLPGPGATVGQYLVEYGNVKLVAFTGSYDVGTNVIRAGAGVRPGHNFIKKMIVEMGGKNAIIVDDDADLDGAVQAVVASAFAFAGQKCSSCSRVIVLDGVYDAFLERLADATRSVPIGPASAPATVVGPVIDQNAKDRIQEFIDKSQADAHLLVRAELPESCADGFFIPPTIIADVKPDAPLAQEEVFGPVLAALRAESFDHALQIANDTRYALTGGVFSRSPAHIDQARREFAVGNLYINRRITGSQVDAQPFGGFKLSGTGVKAGSPEYLTHFMDARCITENTLRSGFVPDQEHTEVS